MMMGSWVEDSSHKFAELSARVLNLTQGRSLGMNLAAIIKLAGTFNVMVEDLVEVV